jgi:hypothetical protein
MSDEVPYVQEANRLQRERDEAVLHREDYENMVIEQGIALRKAKADIFRQNDLMEMLRGDLDHARALAQGLLLLCELCVKNHPEPGIVPETVAEARRQVDEWEESDP